MKLSRLTIAMLSACVGVGMAPFTASAVVFTQCPGDTNQDTRYTGAEVRPPNVKCVHLTAGDGFIKMGDNYPQYMFGFNDVTGVSANQVSSRGLLAANFPAPTMVFEQNDEAYVNLTNVSMVKRPDLADGHSVHYHGFPQAAPVFDGTPESSIEIREGATLTYYYKNMEPGTYIYHCHVEAAEHMQMGMLGNLYVLPSQNKLPDGTVFPNGFVHRNTGPVNGANRYKYAYNDNDGSTRYQVEAALQLSGFDSDFHDASASVQPLSFSEMRDKYAMINGRGYPDTKIAGALPGSLAENNNQVSQKITSLVTANAGQKVLLRISNLSVTRYYSIGLLGLPMKVIANGGRLLRGPDGKDTTFNTSSITIGGGETMDVLIDTAGVAAGTYFLYTTNLNYLSNNAEDFGGMMTEIHVN